MKKVIYSFGLLAAMLMTSCGNEDEPKVDINMPGDGIPARLTLSLPTGGSRSQTVTPDDNTNSSNGFEVGQDSENKVNSVIVLLAKNNSTSATPSPADFEFIAAAQADATPDNGATATNGRPTFTVRFKSQAVADNATKTVNVFAYCNPTTELIRAVETLEPASETNPTGDTFADLICTLTDADASAIWVQNSFLMTNRDLASATLPTVEVMEKADRHNPVDLGTVKVQRAAVRFDFAQTTVEGQTQANYYPIVSAADETITEGYVQLTDMALFNLSKTFYYLPRMSMDATWTPSVLCQRESTNNWVVSTDYGFKSAYKGQDASASYYYPISTAGFGPASLTNYDALSSLSVDDDDNNWTPGTDAEGKPIANPGYKIWRYATENTIPGVDEQKKGITTGVLFKGNIIAVPGTDMATAMAAKQVIYAYDGHVYGNKDQLKAAVEAAPSTTISDMYNTLFVTDNLDSNGDIIQTCEDGFAIYRPDAAGNYPCYYYYYNRHDDNSANMTMGMMEFATVRNNIYKLKINSIMEFGHPGNPGDDPDPEDPDDPDESPKTYFKLAVQVLPWVVRVNTIDL